MKEPTVHVDSAEQREGVATEFSERCPHCGGELETGFGFAGGGFGPYQYCAACESVTAKVQVSE